MGGPVEALRRVEVSMPGVHHTAICTADVERSMRFWRDGIGLTELFDHNFTGDWPTLFNAATTTLRSVFLGDPEHPDTGVVELVVFDGAAVAPPRPDGPCCGFFLVSLERDVDSTLATLASLGFTEGTRRIAVPAPGGQRVQMAVVIAPDDVLVELIGPPQ